MSLTMKQYTPLTAKEVADRLEIQEVINRYSYALDLRKRDEWERVGSKDARWDYGGPSPQSPTELWEAWTNPEREAKRISGVHFIGNIVIKSIEGDTAKTRCEVFYSRMDRTSEKPEHARLSLTGVAFDDELIRTADGWRIRSRKMTSRWSRPAEDVPWKG